MLTLLCLLLVQEPSAALHWPHWRGPAHDGVAPVRLATEFGDDKNLRWKIELPGRGVSSPLVVGARLYLTTAVPSGSAPVEGVAAEEQSFELHAYERADGKLAWKAVACVATPHEGFHKSYGSYASASPVCDGERLYVSFGSQGLHAYGLDGKLLWKHELGTRLVMRNGFGEGLAPVLAGDVLVQVCDQEEDSFVVALDKRTGKELWRSARTEPSTWATPLVTSVGDRLEVVTGGTTKVRSYAPRDGTLLWECAGLGLNVIPALVRHGDLVLAMSGYRDPRLMAIRLGKSGDLSGTDAVAWSSVKGCAYTASPVLHAGLYYTVTDRGLISCFDAASGAAHYLEERLPRGSQLKSSPIAAGEFLYVPTEAGEVHLVRLGPKLDVAATNTFAEQVFIASPAAAEGTLYLRSLTHLFAVGP
jgi:outer membrane protein assembly factor BamB